MSFEVPRSVDVLLHKSSREGDGRVGFTPHSKLEVQAHLVLVRTLPISDESMARFSITP